MSVILPLLGCLMEAKTSLIGVLVKSRRASELLRMSWGVVQSVDGLFKVSYMMWTESFVFWDVNAIFCDSCYCFEEL